MNQKLSCNYWMMETASFSIIASEFFSLPIYFFLFFNFLKCPLHLLPPLRLLPTIKHPRGKKNTCNEVTYFYVSFASISSSSCFWAELCLNIKKYVGNFCAIFPSIKKKKKYRI